jgi:hypothetical protein
MLNTLILKKNKILQIELGAQILLKIQSKLVCLKMALNAHSTAVMAALGRLVGNTMTNVSPSNLKLIGRATNLILMHVNQALLPHRLDFKVTLDQ